MADWSLVDHEISNQLEASGASTSVDVGLLDLLLDLLSLDSSLQEGEDGCDSRVPDLSLALCETLDRSSGGLHLLPRLQPSLPIELGLWKSFKAAWSPEH